MVILIVFFVGNPVIKFTDKSTVPYDPRTAPYNKKEIVYNNDYLSHVTYPYDKIKAYTFLKGAL